MTQLVVFQEFFLDSESSSQLAKGTIFVHRLIGLFDYPQRRRWNRHPRSKRKNEPTNCWGGTFWKNAGSVHNRRCLGRMNRPMQQCFLMWFSRTLVRYPFSQAHEMSSKVSTIACISQTISFLFIYYTYISTCIHYVNTCTRNSIHMNSCIYIYYLNMYKSVYIIDITYMNMQIRRISWRHH